MGDDMKMNFDYFQIQKWMLLTVRAVEIDEKNGVICLLSMFPSWVKILKLSKKEHFPNFVLTSARNISQSKQVTSEISYYTLSENYMIYKGLTHRS